MDGLPNALAFAAALTALFAFRFRVRRPGHLAGYFTFFAVLEAVVQARLLPEGAIPPVTALVLSGIAVLFAAGVVALRRLEASESRERG